MRVKQDGGGLMVTSKHHKRPAKNDLIYFESSPDYCIADEVTGTCLRHCRRLYDLY